MSAPFQPGDVVVCVDDRRSLDFYCADQSWTVSITRGAYYRVTGIVLTIPGPALLLDGERPHTCSCCDGENGWNPHRFRKIDDDVTEEFREQLRKLPVKDRERVA